MNFATDLKSNFAEVWGVIWTFTNLSMPFLTVFAAWEGMVWAWVVPVMIVIVIPLADHLLRKMDPAWFQTRGKISNSLRDFYAVVQILFTLLHIPVFVLVLWGLKDDLGFFSIDISFSPFSIGFSSGEYDLFSAAGTILSFATYGALVLANAHDLMHRRSNWARALGIVNQKLYFYPANFEIEHINRHHTRKWMGKPDDVESAPRGMTFYQFFRGLNSEGDRINEFEEKKRLAQKGLPWRSIHNRLLQSNIIRVLIVLCLVIVLPLPVALAGMIMLFLSTASFSCSGYFQHYGLEREDVEEGVPKMITTKHRRTQSLTLFHAPSFSFSLYTDA